MKPMLPRSPHSLRAIGFGALALVSAGSLTRAGADTVAAHPVRESSAKTFSVAPTVGCPGMLGDVAIPILTRFARGEQ